MLLSDLLRAEVRDGNNQHIGVVHDVRAVHEDGEGEGIGRYQISGLMVGPARAGHLGFGRPEVKRPFLLRWLVAWLERRLEYVSWDQVVSVEPGSVVVRSTRRKKSSGRRSKGQ